MKNNSIYVLKMKISFLIFCLFCTIAISAQQPGSKVNILGSNGKLESIGVILEADGNFYKVKYENELVKWKACTSLTLAGNVPIAARPGGGYNVGEKMEVYDAEVWEPAVILEVDGERYKIHFLNWGSNWDRWVGKEKTRIPGATKTNQSKSVVNKTPDNNAGKDPVMNGAYPKIIGTAWAVLSIYDKGTQPKYNRVHPVYLFCNNGRYEMQSGSFITMGNYRVAGNRIIQTSDGADKLTESYVMVWNAKEKWLELISSTTVIRLLYHATTRC